MTETKEDIQAQIDQLDADWEREREPLLVQDHERHPKRAPKNPIAQTVLLWLFVFVLVARLAGVAYDYFTYSSPSYLPEEVAWIDSNWLGLLSVLFWLPLLPFLFRGARRSMRRYEQYLVGLGVYESKRAELQAQLDGVSDGEGSQS